MDEDKIYVEKLNAVPYIGNLSAEECGEWERFCLKERASFDLFNNIEALESVWLIKEKSDEGDLQFLIRSSCSTQFDRDCLLGDVGSILIKNSELRVGPIYDYEKSFLDTFGDEACFQGYLRKMIDEKKLLCIYRKEKR